MKKRKLLLDAGCGEAKCCIDYAKKGYDVIGIEKDRHIFERAKANVEKSKEKKFITLYKKDIRKTKLNKKFDRILFNYVLMFMSKKDVLAVIEKFYKKLNKKGKILIRVLMFDDAVAINAKQRKKEKYVFFPSYDEMKEIKKQYKGKLEFVLRRENAHDGYNFPHIHSIGILKIVK